MADSRGRAWRRALLLRPAPAVISKEGRLASRHARPCATAANTVRTEMIHQAVPMTTYNHARYPIYYNFYSKCDTLMDERKTTSHFQGKQGRQLNTARDK